MSDIKKTALQEAENFLSLKSIGLVGVSEKPEKFGNMIFRELKEKKYNVYQLHPNQNTLNNNPCYKTVAEVPEKLEGIIINAKSNKVIPIIKEFHEQGISNFWIQRGAHSDEAAQYCIDNGINAINGKCILMFAEPVSSVHKFHRVIWNWFGKK